VIAGKFSLAGLYQKLGITAEKLAFGRRADMFSSFRPMSPEERKFLKNQILWTYDQFLTKAAEGRNLTKEAVDLIGKGRVWTGRQAKENGLVDELGGLTMAIGQAKKLAGIPAEEEVRLVIWPKTTSLLARLFGRPEAKVKLPLPGELGKLLASLKALEKENPWAVMPFWLPTQ
jgi:protease-4